MKTILENLNFRYATKTYNKDKKISAADFADILEAGRLSPSSFGLQPFRLIVVENEATRALLRAKGYDQTPITDASHLVVFAVVKNIDEAYVDAYIDNIVATRGAPREALVGFRTMMVGAVTAMSPEVSYWWASKQAYIALSSMLLAAAEKGIDATPMEGFDTKGFDEVLGLKDKGLASCVIATFGYRSNDDAMAGYTKVRLPESEFVITL